MKSLVFVDSEESYDKFDVAILIKTSALRREEMLVHYLDELTEHIPRERIIAFDVPYKGAKAPAAMRKEYLDELQPTLEELGVKTVIVADGEYFKTITKEKKVDPCYGYIKAGQYKGYEDLNIIAVPNYTTLFYDESNQAKIDMGLKACVDSYLGRYRELGKDIIRYVDYPQTIPEIEAWLDKLHDYPTLAMDIEAYSLKFFKAGLGTISFAWNQHEGIAFNVDHLRTDMERRQVRWLLTRFFNNYKGRARWHNGSYDLTVLIYELYMKSLLDQAGMLKGLDTLCRNWDDTKIITYLATNNCSQNHLGLKFNSHEFAGNYAVEDIDDINLIEPKALLEYNVKDSLSTNYVYDKYWPVVLADNQRYVYEVIMMPALKNIIQMQLTGLPLDMNEVKKVHAELTAERDSYLDTLKSSFLVPYLEENIRIRKAYLANNRYKVKRVTPEDYDDKFNPNSPQQLQELLYDLAGFPIVDRTKTKAPATDAESLERLKNYAREPYQLELINALISYSKVDKILTSFIPAFLEAPQAEDGWHYLFGYFNLGGTKSGRLSSSNPNLQNIPSSRSPYSKIIKRCFRAPKGWLFTGLDFDSLEDRISALTTRDPNKIKVYTDGFDGHCLRAFYYFKDRMPDIIETVDSINSIADKYPDERRDSKSPTFALTYLGTWMTLVKNLGWPEALAKQVEAAFHEMYAESFKWTKAQVELAAQRGYAVLAFGLRLRAPMLAKCNIHSDSMPKEAMKEYRTIGNALGQSWGLLNTRAAVQVMHKMEQPDNYDYRMNIKPCAHIHDAQYYLVRNNLKYIRFLNDALQEAVTWQEDPLIAHDEVKLGGALAIFYPTWADEMDLPRHATDEEIVDTCVRWKNSIRRRYVRKRDESRRHPKALRYYSCVPG